MSTEGMMSRRKWIVGAGVAAIVAGTREYAQGPVYKPKEERDMAEKIVVITGGNTGLGKQTAIQLAKYGAEVVIAVRNEQRGREAVEEIKKEANSDKIEAMKCDLASKKSIEEFVKQLGKEKSRVDVLVNNAGGIVRNPQKSS